MRLALAELGRAPELIDVRPWDLPNDVLALNPAGTLPILTVRGGNHMFAGAVPILEFLAELQDSGTLDDWLGPTEGPTSRTPPMTLMPGDTAERAEVRRLVDWFYVKCDREVTQEFLYEKVRTTLDRAHVPAAPNTAMLRAARANLKYHLSYLAFLASRRNWLAGDAPSVADLIAAAHVSLADYLGEIHWADHPDVQAWYQRLKSRRAFQGLLGDRVPGVPPAAHYANLDF